MPYSKEKPSFKHHLGPIYTLVFKYNVVLLLLTHRCAGQSQVITPSHPIVATLGDDITLPCHLEPAIDVSSETVEWARPDLDPRFVYVRRSGVELESRKHQVFAGRTSLSINKLKDGDISLKLDKVKVSDEGTYRCFVPSLQRESSVQLVVGATSSLIISLEKTDGDEDVSGAVLQCESKGWYPKPEVLWLDGEGKLLSAGPAEPIRGPDGLYTVSSRLTVEKKHSKSFTCRVQQKNINQTRETTLYVSDDLFKFPSSSSAITAGFAVSLSFCILLILLLVFFLWRVNRNKIKKTHQCEEGREGEQLMSAETEKVSQQLQEEQQKREEAENKVKNLEDQLKTKNKELKEEMEKKEKELQTLKKELEKNNKEVHIVIDDLKKLNEEMEKNMTERELQTLKEELEQKNKELEEIRNRSFSLRFSSKDQKQKQKEVRTLEEKLETLEREFNTKVDKAGEHSAELLTPNEEMEKNVKELQNLKDELKQKNEEVSQQLQEEQQKREEAENKVKNLEDQLETKDKELKAKLQKKKELKTLNEELEEKNKQMEELEDGLQKLREENQELENEKTKVSQQLQEEQQRREEAENKVKNLKELNEEIEKKEKELQTLKKEVEKKNKRLEKIQGSNRDTSVEATKQQDGLKDLNEKLEEKEKELQTLKEELGKMIKEMDTDTEGESRQPEAAN